MAREKDVVLDHSYDGIQEYDNPLPGWWTGLSVILVIISVIYVPWMHAGLGGPTQVEEFDASMAAYKEAYPDLFKEPEAGEDGEVKVALADIDVSKFKGNPDAIAKGKATFAVMCAPCHQADATGKIGPNLTDNEWIHGGNYEDIRHTITFGVPDKGMVTWGQSLTGEQIAEAAAFVHSLGGATD